jgi:molybdenum cofactor synthesis domain-containing protein
VRDDPDALRETIQRAALNADVIISSGGVSVGEADFAREVLNKLGDVVFWTLAIRPGRPLAIGQIGSAAYFGLPGNPVRVSPSHREPFARKPGRRSRGRVRRRAAFRRTHLKAQP